MSQAELRIALVGEEHRELYLNDGYFRQSIDFLASMLPAMVRGLADAAEESAAKRRETIRELMSGTWSVFPDPNADPFKPKWSANENNATSE